MSVHVVEAAAECKVRFRVSTAERRRVFTVRADRPCARNFTLRQAIEIRELDGRTLLWRETCECAFTRPSNCCCDAALSMLNVEIAVASTSGSPAAGLCRRNCEIARFARNHHKPCGQRTAPRASNRDGALQSWKKISCKISSAVCVSRKSGSGQRKAFLHSGHTARRARLVPLRDSLDERRVRGSQLRSRFPNSPAFWGLPSIRYARTGIPDWPAMWIAFGRNRCARPAQYRARRSGVNGVVAQHGRRTGLRHNNPRRPGW